MSELHDRARAYLAGESLTVEEVNRLWQALKEADDLALARAVLAQFRKGEGLIDGPVRDRRRRQELCRQEALLTSKDLDLSATIRHDRALELLADEFDLDDPGLDGDAETLGIAGGILKRRWSDLGQLEDLRRAGQLYSRGAAGLLGNDAYADINAAFIEDLLAAAGDQSAERKDRARALRERIVAELPASQEWWPTASRAEALFGLGRYEDATEVIKSASRPAPWKLHSTAQQLATIAHLREKRPQAVPEVRTFFAALLPGAADAVRSAFLGKVGLALSGGGFRASFYHLGVLARLAELNVLRHLDVLSCVSGGSIVGACYWLALRRRLLDRCPLDREAYVELVHGLIDHFERAVAEGLRGTIQPTWFAVGKRLLRGERGVLDPELAAEGFEEHFLSPLLANDEPGPVYMDQLPFTPVDHDPRLSGSGDFHPGRHNWLRAHKVPALVLNATSVNTGHAWQFTPTWMGESPWAVHPAADSVPRLQWSWYAPAAAWRMRLSRAVAASASVPGVFAPVRIDGAYDNLQVQLVDGGVHDNQGTVALLALNCNVLLVSDAAGQLMLERKPAPGLGGLVSYANRSMDTLMERIRQANYADLDARRRTGLLRGLMFLHMKAGLDADVIRLLFSQETYELRRSPLSPSGVRKDFQQALAEIRTDLDVFTGNESRALMACGYQMAAKAFQRDLAALGELWDDPAPAEWPFAEQLAEITSVAPATAGRGVLLDELRNGSKTRL